MFSGRKSAGSDAGGRFAASVSGNTGVEVFSGKTGKPRVSNLRPCCRFFQRKLRAGLAARSEVGGQAEPMAAATAGRASDSTIRYGNRRLPGGDPSAAVLAT